MDQAEQKHKQEENKKMEDRCKQMVELKLREDEVCGYCRSCFCGNRQYYKFINFLSQSLQLKEEQKALFVKQKQLEKLEKERKQLEEKQKSSEKQ